MIATATLLPERRVQRAHPEDDLQRALVTFLRFALPPDAVVLHVPNGGKRHAREAARLKGLGVLAGVPDLLVIAAGRAFWLELKSARGVLSQAQRETQRRLNYAGSECMVVRSIADAEAALRECGVRLKGTVAA